MQPRDPKTGPGQRPDGRPPFGLGPIARVSTVAVGRSVSASLPAAAMQAAVAPTLTSPLAGPAARRPVVGIPVGSAPATGRTAAAPSGPGSGIGSVRPVRAFGIPNVRRNVCPHFYVTSARGAIPINAPHLLRGLVRQERTVSRCQLRGGVHLEPGFVNDVCLSPRFNQCVFYEEELSER